MDMAVTLRSGFMLVPALFGCVTVVTGGCENKGQECPLVMGID